MGVISEGKAALELTRELVSYLKKAGEHDPKLVGMFEDLREKVLALYESDIELRQQVRELEEKLNLREEVVFDQKKGVYYKGTPGDIKDGPFCGKCYNEGKGLVPMREWDDHGFYENQSTSYKWLCLSCDFTALR